jgi:hypothetical protein
MPIHYKSPKNELINFFLSRGLKYNGTKTYAKKNYRLKSFNNLYTVDRPIPICLAISVRPIALRYISKTLFLSIDLLRQNFTPLDFAAIRPSLVLSKIRCRSA